jgi:hypothetical protein
LSKRGEFPPERHLYEAGGIILAAVRLSVSIHRNGGSRMKRNIVVWFAVMTIIALSSPASAQQQPMPSRSAKYESIQLGEVVWELGQPSSGQIAVTWKVELSNTDTKDHTSDLQVKFLDAQGAEIFHDSVLRNKIPAKGTVTISNTATVDAAKAQSIKSTKALVRARN